MENSRIVPVARLLNWCCRPGAVVHCLMSGDVRTARRRRERLFPNFPPALAKWTLLRWLLLRLYTENLIFEPQVFPVGKDFCLSLVLSAY